VPAISVEKLGKTYVVPVREPGRARARSLFRRESRQVTAVGAIEFAVEPGVSASSVPTAPARRPP
jgi:ABC-type uncharacterized transport system ATPase subunit